MIKNVKNVLLIAVMSFTATWTSVASADIGQTDKITLESVAVLGETLGSRMEIKILKGFSLPKNVSCDTNYISTKNNNDSDRAMLSLLREAIVTKHKVRLWITDDPESTASAPGRCSLLAVELF